jgi:hypothetical protein
LEDNDPVKKGKMRQIEAIETYLETNRGKTFSVDETTLDAMDEDTRAKNIESLAAEIESKEKGLQARFNFEVEKIVAKAKIDKIPLTDLSITEKLGKLEEDLIIPFGQKKQQVIKVLVEQYDKLPEKHKVFALRNQIKHAIEGTEGTLLTRVVKGVKGRAKMMVLMASLIFATDQIIHKNDAERDLAEIIDELGPDFGQLLLDVLPVAGTFSNFYSAFTGREIVSKRDVSGIWDRTSNVMWGTVGAAGDVLTVLGALPSGGTGIGANVALRLAKEAKAGSKTAAKMIEMWPRISKVADRMGGWKKFAEKTAEFVKKDPEKMRKMAKGLRAIETVGTIAGTTMLVGGVAYNMHYAFTDAETEMDIPADLIDTGKMPQEAKHETKTPEQTTSENG